MFEIAGMVAAQGSHILTSQEQFSNLTIYSVEVFANTYLLTIWCSFVCHCGCVTPLVSMYDQVNKAQVIHCPTVVSRLKGRTDLKQSVHDMD